MAKIYFKLIYQAKHLKKLAKRLKSALSDFFEQSIIENRDIIIDMSKSSLFLAKPQMLYHKAFIEAVNELQAFKHDRYYVEKDLDAQALAQKENFENYLKDLEQQELGINLAANRVPQTIYWLMDEQVDGQIRCIGRVAIRHRLTEYLRRIGGHVGYVIRPSARKQGYGAKLLALTLEKISQEQPRLDDNRVLLTCDETNLGSKKIIEKNNGVLTAINEQKPPLPRKLLYWIELHP
jgi:predicted acetyltransferase